MNHDVKEDTAGWTDRSRLTCFTCEKTIVRQPYMTTKEWMTRVELFKQAHPDEGELVDHLGKDRLS